MASIRKLEIDEVREIYKTRMQEDFPPDELRPLSSIVQLTEEGCYLSLGYFDGEGSKQLIAYAFFVKEKNRPAALLDYYAVAAEARGTGIGSKFLSDFHTVLLPLNVTHIILEVENPTKTDDEKEIAIRNRRIGFYKRSLCEMSGVYSKLFGVEYNVMYLSFNGSSIDDTTIAQELDDLYHLMLAPILKTPEDYSKRAAIRFEN